MAVPKRRTSKTRKNRRRAHDALALPARANCPQCGATRAPHRVCGECGFYAGETRIQPADGE
jgi:large subunit ribosomal protein L32